MSKYVDLRFVLGDAGRCIPTLACCRQAEAAITGSFMPLYRKFVDGDIAEGEYLEFYDSISAGFFSSYTDAFGCYLRMSGPGNIR